MKRKALYTLPNEVREQRGLDCAQRAEWGILKSLSPVSLRSSADDLPLPVRYAH